jgi:hypothetical protein
MVNWETETVNMDVHSTWPLGPVEQSFCHSKTMIVRLALSQLL